MPTNKANHGGQKRLPTLRVMACPVLNITQVSLGKEHHQAALILGNIGTVYLHQGSFNKALPMYREALTIRKNS